jgi:molecular chaperone GrpE
MERVDEDNLVAAEDTGLERLKADLRAEHDLYLRALADFENYRRRMERDRAKTAAKAKRDILLSLLEVLDGFDRALPYLSADSSSVAEGLQAVYRSLKNLLEAQGVTPIKTVGEPFDPSLHEAIGAVNTDKYPSGTIAEEVQRGYMLAGELLRPARVRVAR